MKHNRIETQLIEKFQTRQARVAVIGLGYVGLPLAVNFAQAGYKVVGIDLDRRKVEAINHGASYIEDVPNEVIAQLTGATLTGIQTQAQFATHVEQPTRVRQAGDHLLLKHVQNALGSPQQQAGVEAPRLRATMDFSVLATCDAVSICVPTPLNKTGDPDVSYIIAAAEQIARYLRPGVVVVLESTTYPGTTREVVLPILEGRKTATAGRVAEEHQGRVLTVGQDFFLAFSPERIDPGRRDWMTHNTPKVMGGVTPTCLAIASAFYAAAIEHLVPVSSPDAAEMVKLFENTFRMVNIGLANELLLMCDKLGLDAWEILDAAATKPFGFMRFTPGPGLGGHCIPVDPHYLSWKLRTLRYNAQFIELASKINLSMPTYWVQKVQDALNHAGKAVRGSRVLVLGVAYKKDVSDMRESPALDIIHLLEEKGAVVIYHDPHIAAFQHEDFEMVSVTNLHHALTTADAVVIATDHAQYDWQAIQEHAALLIDTRHVVVTKTFRE